MMKTRKLILSIPLQGNLPPEIIYCGLSERWLLGPTMPACAHLRVTTTPAAASLLLLLVFLENFIYQGLNSVCLSYPVFRCTLKQLKWGPRYQEKYLLQYMQKHFSKCKILIKDGEQEKIKHCNTHNPTVSEYNHCCYFAYLNYIYHTCKHVQATT